MAGERCGAKPKAFSCGVVAVLVTGPLGLWRETQVSRRIADFLLGDETLTPPFPGLLRYLAWTAMASALVRLLRHALAVQANRLPVL